jgi:hypothetical protein
MASNIVYDLNLLPASSSSKVWRYIDFDHPTTFETLAMHPAKKRKIMDDLDRNNKDYYRRIGKAWKRGYLLYGPPGTGKSTMIAAMANYLNYDIYDIDVAVAVAAASKLRPVAVVALLLRSPERSREQLMSSTCSRSG